MCRPRPTAPATPGSPPCARRRRAPSCGCHPVRRGARAARQVPAHPSCATHHSEVVEDAVLLVSELVTNSVKHGGPPVVVARRLRRRGPAGPGPRRLPRLPAPRDALQTDESGRGLALVKTCRPTGAWTPSRTASTSGSCSAPPSASSATSSGSRAAGSRRLLEQLAVDHLARRRRDLAGCGRRGSRPRRAASLLRGPGCPTCVRSFSSGRNNTTTKASTSTSAGDPEHQVHRAGEAVEERPGQPRRRGPGQERRVVQRARRQRRRRT